ncbi:ERF family protein [Nosocomiicoccus massiliensis]|uniref:ERF family protein n=1 Tax=Nosocomiicoccus massiliensis TaxID=1232430 RepID=UPI000406B1B8|nr:ERF family protein [Nosocomiicoccus massiliensis]
MIKDKSESIKHISEAMAKFQGEVTQPKKDKTNPFFKSKYVPLENVVEVITDEAPKHGLSFFQSPCNDEHGRIGISTLVTHQSGEFIEFEPLFMKAEKNNAQGSGALITYLRRYTLSSIFGITSDEDDDGNATSSPARQTPQLANEQQLKTLKDEIEAFTQKFEQATEETVLDTLGIQNINQLNVKQVNNAVRTLKEWSKQND